MSWLFSETSSVDPLGPLYSVGVVGVIVILFVLGQLFAKPSVEKIETTLNASADAWKKAYEIERDAHMALQQDRTAQLERDQLTHKLLEEIRATARGVESK